MKRCQAYYLSFCCAIQGDRMHEFFCRRNDAIWITRQQRPTVYARVLLISAQLDTSRVCCFLPIGIIFLNVIR